MKQSSMSLLVVSVDVDIWTWNLAILEVNRGLMKSFFSKLDRQNNHQNIPTLLLPILMIKLMSVIMIKTINGTLSDYATTHLINKWKDLSLYASMQDPHLN